MQRYPGALQCNRGQDQQIQARWHFRLERAWRPQPPRDTQDHC